MSNEAFVAILVSGAAVLALWTHVRFPSLAPDGLPRALVHAVISIALLQLVPDSGESVVSAFVVVFGFALPAFVYCFLAAIWLLRVWQTAVGAAR